MLEKGQRVEVTVFLRRGGIDFQKAKVLQDDGQGFVKVRNLVTKSENWVRSDYVNPHN